jgi:carotenoid 1,2-hydratase
VAPGGYLWWYVDAISDDGRHALTLIAFVGSVFSSWYAWAKRRDGDAVNPENHCALNVALYGAGGRRWTMTERGQRWVRRQPDRFDIGPSHLHWDGRSLLIQIDEVGSPLPQRVRGTVRVTPQGNPCRFVAALDAEGCHRWGPIAPCARVEVDLDAPANRWQGHAYLDSNEGDEPLERPFASWDWSRSVMDDGSTAVIYDVRNRVGPDRVIARRFLPDGSDLPFELPPRQTLRSSGWRIPRAMRSEAGAPVAVTQTLEDTPFYARSMLHSNLLGQRVLSVHESLSVPRLEALTTRLMLPFKMPRRG